MFAEFVPKNHCTLQEVATASGFDHFNWINLVTHAPLDNVIMCSGQTSLPVLDPIPGWWPFCGHGWADNLDYYYDEVDQSGSASNADLQEATSLWSLDFADQPGWATLGAGNTVRFVTALVGVRYGNSYELLSAFTWETTFNGTTGNTTLLAQRLSVWDLSPAVREYLDEHGAVNVPIFVDGFESGGIGAW